MRTFDEWYDAYKEQYALSVDWYPILEACWVSSGIAVQNECVKECTKMSRVLAQNPKKRYKFASEISTMLGEALQSLEVK